MGMFKLGGAQGYDVEKEQAVQQIIGFIGEIVGDDVAMFMEISPQSKFFSDLSMDSIEIINLAEKINNHYGEQVDFISWLSGKNLKKIMALSVGDVADVIAGSVCGMSA